MWVPWPSGATHGRPPHVRWDPRGRTLGACDVGGAQHARPWSRDVCVACGVGDAQRMRPSTGHTRQELGMRRASGRASAVRHVRRGYVCVHARPCAGAASHVRPVPRDCLRRTTGRPDTFVSALQTLHGMNLSCAMLRACTVLRGMCDSTPSAGRRGGVLACMGCPPCWGSVWVPSFGKSLRIWRLLRARPLAFSLRSGERVSRPDA